MSLDSQQPEMLQVRLGGCAAWWNCRAHAAKVRSIWWSPDDAALLTCAADGSVFQWRVAGLARLKQFALQARPRASAHM